MNLKKLKQWQLDNKISNIKLAEILHVTPVMISIYRSTDSYYVADTGEIYQKVRRLKGITKTQL